MGKKEKKQMSKRAPGSNLNQDNWDADEGPAVEQGTWNRAGESTLKSRVIMRAKRRGGGAGEAKQSAFGGLSAKLTVAPSSLPSQQPDQAVVVVVAMTIMYRPKR